MNYKDKKFLEKILKHKRRLIKNNSYPLTLENPLDVDDIIKGIEVLLDGQVTMSTITKKFTIKWFIKRKEAFEYVKFIMKKKGKKFIPSLDYYITTIINKIISFL